MAAPGWAQTTTGQLMTWLGTGFTMPATVEINGNHEWEVNYTVDLANAISNSIRTCKVSNPPDTCTIESPHLMIYAEVSDYRSCLSLNAYTRGIRGNIPFDSW